MKTIGTCKECKWWANCKYAGHSQRECGNDKLDSKDDDGFYHGSEYGKEAGKDFGCIHWESNHQSTNPNYPVKDAKDLLIDDLKRENDAAFKRIQELSRALVDLGYDPTYKK